MGCSAVKQRCRFRPQSRTQQHHPGVSLEITPISDGDDRSEVCIELRRRITHRARALLLVSPGDLAKRLAAMLSELQPVLISGKTQQACRFGIAGIDQLLDASLPSGWNLFIVAGSLPSGLGAVTKAMSRIALRGRVPVIHFVESRRAPP